MTVAVRAPGPDGYPYGFYVWDFDDPAKLTAPPRVTITLPYRVTWSYGTGNTDWKLVSSSGTTYVFEYQGSYTVGTLNGKPTVYLSGRPHFRGTVSALALRTTARRSSAAHKSTARTFASPELDETPAASDSAEADAEEATPQKEEVISSEKALT